MHRKFGKKDVIFIGALLGICLIVLGVWYFAGGKQGASVVVTREGEVYGTYSLSQPQTVKIKNSKGKTTNVLVIRDGKADMKEADCPDKLCVHQKAISAENESIVCLPNRVVVTVTNSKKEGMDWRKTAFMGVFLALAMICSYIEMLIPFDFGIPGVKLGLTNIVVVLMLYSIGTKEAFCVSIIRIFLVGILFGNLIGILYSLGGGILSFLVMALLKKGNHLGCISVSVAGGIAHNIGQILIAALVVSSHYVLYYFPVLLIAGLLTGFLIGFLAQELIVRLRFLTEKYHE